ncbi:MAG TPA: flagellar basal body P-ring formation chaperone FlgA [Kofleriaceae bacterium]|nr:flagellar basal body P-ring formation chaperone FlgA [Kofleriaceae bacterium]
MRAITYLALALALAVPAAARADTSDRIRAEIDSALPAELRAVEIRVPKALSSAGSDSIQVDWSRPARPGWLSLRVRAGDRSGWVRARLAAVAATVVAARDLPAGHRIGEADVRVEMRPIAPGSQPIAGIEGVVGRALRQPAAAGAPLAQSALDRAAPMPRGHQVTALVRRGRLSISAAGVLERAAPIGQDTTVRLRATGRVVRGRLVDSRTVLLEVSP